MAHNTLREACQRPHQSEDIYKLRATHCLTAPRVSYLPPPSPPSATRVSTDTSHYVRKVPLLRRPTEAQIREPPALAI